MLNRCKYLLWVVLTLPSFGQNIDVSRVRGVGYVSDESFLTLPAACASAVSQGLGLQVSKSWSALTTQSLTCPLTFVTGGIIQPANGQTVTLTNNYCPSSRQCYDVSLGGTIAFSVSASGSTPQNWGAKADSTTNSTAGLQACINAAWTTGTLCHLPASTGTYNTTGLTLPTVILNNWQIVGIEGEGAVHLIQPNAYGSTIHCTGSADCIVGNLSVFSDASYIFRDFSLIGPDSSSSGAISGHGFNINATAAAPRVKMSNVSALGFYGAGKYGIRLVGPEDSSFSDVDSSDNNACLFMGGGFNGNSIVNFTCQGATGADAILAQNATEISWQGGVIQSNAHNGIRLNGAIGWTFVSAHFENNNTSATAGQCAVVLDGTASGNNEYIKLIGGGLFTSHDCILFKSPDNTGVNVFNRIDGVYSAPVSNPKISFDSFSSNNRVIDIISDCTGATDTGTANVYQVANNQFSCVAGAATQMFKGNVGFGGNTAPGVAVDIHQATDTQGFRIGDDTVTQSYAYIKPHFDGGGSTGTLGAVFNGGSAIDVLQWSGNPLWLQTLAPLQNASFLFANLPTAGLQAGNGVQLYCSNCTIANPCAGAGTGAIAKRLNGIWVCN